MARAEDPLSDDPPPVGGSDDDDEKNPIGVPDDYSVPRRQYGREEMGDIRFRRQPQSWVTNVGPVYFDGDEYIPANWTSNQIWMMQQALANVGLLSGTFTRNVWDDTTRNAYKQLLGLANAQGLDVDRTLQELLATAGSEEGARWKVDENGNVVPAGGSAAPPPLVKRHTDPTTLRSTFRKAVIEMLGEGWSQEDINKMVQAYHGVESQRQEQAYNMEIAGKAGTITDIPSPEAFVEDYVTKKDPMGVQTQDALGFSQEFMDLASSTAWGVG